MDLFCSFRFLENLHSSYKLCRRAVRPERWFGLCLFFYQRKVIFDFFEKSTSHGIIPQSFCVLVVKFHQPPRHVMFKGEEMVVPEHQTGDVHLKRKHSSSRHLFLSYWRPTSSWHCPPPARPTAPPIRFCSADAATAASCFHPNLYPSLTKTNLRGQNVWGAAGPPQQVELLQQAGWQVWPPPWKDLWVQKLDCFWCTHPPGLNHLVLAPCGGGFDFLSWRILWNQHERWCCPIPIYFISIK